MPFEDCEITEAQQLQEQRCEEFAILTAERIQAAEDCSFSLLPHEELAQLARGWYEACSQAMLRGNYAGIDRWMRYQSDRAAAEGFILGDVLELLRICRTSAIEVERWNEDTFSEVDELINQAIAAARVWGVPHGFSYLRATTDDHSDVIVEDGEIKERSSERRIFGRNRLQLPIRVRSVGGDQYPTEEFARTHDISSGGLYFLTQENYLAEQTLKVTYPFWTDHGAINREYAATVVRIDQLPGGTKGIAIHFLDSLRRKPK